MGRMDPMDFARRFGLLYREVYVRAVRRIDDGRERLSPETTALLLHLAQAGPSTLTELARHLHRSASTLSVKIGALEDSGLLARQRDADDGRSSLIWLAPAGRDALLQALEVLDAPRIAAAAATLDEPQRRQIVEMLQQLVHAIPAPTPPDGDPHR